MNEREFKKPVCKVIGTDGNVFAIIGLVSKTLRRAGYPDKAKEFMDSAMSQDSYNNVLCLLDEYVIVE